MNYESCRFLFHQFIQRNKTHQIVADLNRLPSFTAALVRRTDVDRPNQFMCGIRSRLFHFCVLFDLLDEKLKILHLLFLQLDLLTQDLHFLFQRLLLVLVIPAHGCKSLVTELSGDVVLIKADEQTIQLFEALVSFLFLFFAFLLSHKPCPKKRTLFCVGI